MTARHDGVDDTAAFVVAATLEGAPEGRRQRVLTDLLTSRSDVLRYLLFLLADLDGSGGIEELAAALSSEHTGTGDMRIDPAGAPLFESLLTALRRDPGRLDHVASLIDELRNDGHATDVLPDGLDAIWEPIWQARQELRS